MSKQCARAPFDCSSTLFAFSVESIDARKAASVLPEPVGAAISVWRRSRMAAQPRSCAGVGAPSVPVNQSETSGWNPGSAMAGSRF